MRIKHLIKYLYLKLKWRGKVHFFLSSQININSRFEGGNLIQRNSEFSGIMGYGSYMANGCSLNGKIGRFTSIGPFVRCNFGIHPYTYPFVSTSPWFYSCNPLKIANSPKFVHNDCFDEYRYIDEGGNLAVEIGSDCWIGEGVFFVGGVKINDGAIVMAHAVVTKEVPPYAIVGGIPAKILGYRFSEEDIKRLLNTEWWNKDIKWISENAKFFKNLDSFFNVCYSNDCKDPKAPF